MKTILRDTRMRPSLTSLTETEMTADFGTLKELYKEVLSATDGNLDSVDIKDACRYILEEIPDFTLNDEYRFIRTDNIDEIQQSEMMDGESLGYFAPYFLVDFLDCPIAVIEGLQNAGKYDILHDWIVSSCSIEDIQQAYNELDGYGHHFASYDGETRSIYVSPTIDYYVFRVG